MTNFFKSFVADESGATAIEYGLIVALVSVAAITALVAMGGSLDEIVTYVTDMFEAGMSAIDFSW